MTIGEFIHKHREEAGLSQTRLGVLMPRWYAQTVSRIEADIRPLKLVEAVQLAQVLRFDMADLLALIVVDDICANCGNRPVHGYQCMTCGRTS